MYKQISPPIFPFNYCLSSSSSNCIQVLSEDIVILADIALSALGLQPILLFNELHKCTHYCYYYYYFLTPVLNSQGRKNMLCMEK